MELIQKDAGNDWILANLEFEYRSRLPVQRIEIDLKTADLVSCDPLPFNTEYKFEAQYIPHIVEEEVPPLPEPEDEPTVVPEVPADVGSTEPSEPVFELDDPEMDDKNPTLITGQNSGSEIEATVSGSGPGFLSCSFQGLGSSALDGWMILGLLGSFFPLIRRLRKK